MSASNEAVRFASALSTTSDTATAVAEVCEQVRQQLGDSPNLVLLFFTTHHSAAASAIAKDVCAQLQTQNVLGCSAQAVAGVGREIEDEPAISLWCAKLPGANLRMMQMQFEKAADGGVITGWPDDLPEKLPADAFLLLLADPFFFPADMLLERLNEDRPGFPVIGGMASGGHSPGQNRLLFGNTVLTEGAIAVLIDGPVRLRTVVSQGCRPIGRPFVVTKSERNIIYELGGRPALLQLKEIFDVLPTKEQALVQHGLHIGRVVSEYQENFGQGDFLVRNVVGIDPKNGAVAAGDYVRVGQTVQFHIRDAETAEAELKQLLAKVRVAGLDRNAGVLLFTCNGRGMSLFRDPDHDAGTIANSLGKLPLAGFFAQGEIGPVGGQNFLHGFTASIAILEPK